LRHFTIQAVIVNAPLKLLSIGIATEVKPIKPGLLQNTLITASGLFLVKLIMLEFPQAAEQFI